MSRPITDLRNTYFTATRAAFDAAMTRKDITRPNKSTEYNIEYNYIHITPLGRLWFTNETVIEMEEPKPRYIIFDGEHFYEESSNDDDLLISDGEYVTYPDSLPGIMEFAGLMKFDQDKNRLELIEPKFIEGLGTILTFGAKKYAANNWKKGSSPEDIERYKGALLRHLMAYLGGETTDPDSNQSHLYHATCNLMFLDYFDRNRDD